MRWRSEKRYYKGLVTPPLCIGRGGTLNGQEEGRRHKEVIHKLDSNFLRGTTDCMLIPILVKDYDHYVLLECLPVSGHFRLYDSYSSKIPTADYLDNVVEELVSYAEALTGVSFPIGC